MRTHALRAWLVAALIGLGACSPSPSTSSNEAALRSQIDRYDVAWMAKDRAVVDEILAPTYLYFTASGGLSDRAESLASLADTSYVLTRSERSEVALVRMGSWARVSSRWVGEGQYRGDAVRDDQTCGQTWRWEREQWMLVTEHCANRPSVDSSAVHTP